MNRDQFYISIDRLARYKYIKNIIDPSGICEDAIMDITTEEIENLYTEAANEITRNLVSSVGTKPYYTAAELRARTETRYQQLLVQGNIPEGSLARLELYTKAEREVLSGMYIDVGPSGVVPEGAVLDGTCENLAPYGIANISY